MGVSALRGEAVLSPESIVRIYKTFESIELIRPAWEAFHPHPNADIDFFQTILKTRANILRPHVVTVEQGEEVVAMLVGRIEAGAIQCRLGYLDLLRPRVRQLTIVYGGVLGDISEPHAELLVNSLLETLRQGEADVATFSKIPIENEIYKVARSRPGLLRRNLAPEVAAHRVIELPSSLEEILKRFSSKRRNKFGRKERLFQRSFPGQISFRFFEQPEEVAQLCEDLDAVARLTYQRGLGAGFVNDEEHRQRLALAASRGALCAFVIYLNGRPCAFGLGTVLRGVFYWEFTGFDPALRRYEVGTLVLTRMLDHLCRKGVRWFDFGLGDADYKRELSTTGWQEATVHLFAPRLRPIVINLVRGLLMLSVQCSQRLPSRLGLDRRLKQLWRRRLSHAGAEDAGAERPAADAADLK